MLTYPWVSYCISSASDHLHCKCFFVSLVFQIQKNYYFTLLLSTLWFVSLKRAVWIRFTYLCVRNLKKKSRLLFWRTNRKWFLSTPDCSLAVIGLDGRCLGNDINPVHASRDPDFSTSKASAPLPAPPLLHPTIHPPSGPSLQHGRSEMKCGAGWEGETVRSV